MDQEAHEHDIDLIHLQQLLAEHFSLSELDQLCFDLEIKFEDLPGQTLSDKSRELVKYSYRRGRLPDLLRRCAELRPKEVWDQPAKIYTRGDLPEEWVEPLQRMYQLVKQFNRNRHEPYSHGRTLRGDEIAFTMREAAPFLFNQFDLRQWLKSESVGKRLAAIEYLDWLQDVEYIGTLLGMLATEAPFLQVHILLAIHSMVDQLDTPHRRTTIVALTAYKALSADPECEVWRKRILAALHSDDAKPQKHS